MKTIILPYSATSNPLGYPGDYPAQRRRIEDIDPIPVGWIEATDVEIQLRIDTHYAAVAAINAAAEAAAGAAERNKMDAFKQLFQDGRAIDQSWGSATAAQKVELARITFRILWLARTSLADSIKPEAS